MGCCEDSTLHDLRAPFPWFGGKRRAAPLVWELLGDPGGYVEPFAGSAAVLLNRPAFKGRRVETLNDLDGWLVNAWRAVQLSPVETAAYAYGPVTEIDYHARLAWLQDRRGDGLVSWLEGDPEAHDPKAAGWWLYVCACGIGDPWNAGPWRVVDGRLVDTRKASESGVRRELPHLGDAGRGVNRGLPHLGDAGQGVNRKLPHLGDAGQEALAAYLSGLSCRLDRVRITCGTWERALTPSASRATAGNPNIGIFLDPPYATSGDLYSAVNSVGLTDEVQQWCLNAPDDLRIVLTGYDGEYPQLEAAGWSKHHGKATNGGYGANGNEKRERIWASPNCTPPQHQNQLFETGTL